MRLRQVLPVLALSLIVGAQAQASPIKVSFAGLVPPAPPWYLVDPLAGVGVSGFFIYDDLFGGIGMTQPPPAGCGPFDCDSFGHNSPMLDFLMNVGPYRYTLADTVLASVHGVIGNQFWGPGVFVKPALLPLGLTSLGLGTAGSDIQFFYTDSFGYGLSQQLPFIFRPVTVASVPEPSSLLFGAGALGLFLLKKKKGSPR